MFSIAGGPRWLSNREVLLALWLHLPRHGRVSWLLSAPLGLGSLAVQVRSGVTRLRTPESVPHSAGCGRGVGVGHRS